MPLKKKYYKLVIIIFFVGFVIRVLSVLPANTVIGFDQARDLWTATTIFRDHDIRILGPTAGNNPNLHHGVNFWYYIIPPLIIFSGNPVGVAIWNSLFNALTIIVVYYFARSLFKSEKAAIISAIILAVSFYYVQFSGWISNPTVCLFTVPVFFYGIWEYYQGKKWALPLSFLFLGLSIAFELFFIYLIPTFILAWLLLKPKFPSLKLIFISVSLFSMATITMILTEIKLHFAGIKAILGAGQFVGGIHEGFLPLLVTFVKDKWEAFYLNIWPQNKDFGLIMGLIAIFFLTYEIVKFKKTRKRSLYLFLMFFSPAIMLLIGIHNAPWFLIGRPVPAILMIAYLISRIRPRVISIFVVIFIFVANVLAVRDSYGAGQPLLEPDSASLMMDQLRAIDYTYQSNMPFEINTLTNPLYINAVWSYHYYWYGKKYGYLPTWGGGDQLYPYNSLLKPSGNEKYLYLIMDTSFRIPPQYKTELINWANKVSRYIEEKQFGGIMVQKRILIN